VSLTASPTSVEHHLIPTLRIIWRYNMGQVSEYRWVGACSCGYRSKYHMSPGYAESAAKDHLKSKKGKR